jgi:hypothetical protein
MYDCKWSIIGRGLNGWHAEGTTDQGNRVSSSGGSLEPYTYWTGEQCPGYLAHAVEGALVYDASQADEDAFARLIISGPMVDPTLPQGTVRKLSERFPQIWGRLTDDLGGLDYVATDIFRELLAGVPGVKIGRVANGAVAWER